MQHHGAGLRRLLTAEKVDEAEREALIQALVSNLEAARVSDADRAMLEYALKLTHAPSQVNAEDVQRLRRQSFDDRAIHDICAITAYFAFVNRIADGLGVELEA